MQEETPPRARIYPEFARTSFLVYLLIGSLAVGFLAIFVAYSMRFIIIGYSSVSLRELPVLFWWSTGLLLLGSHFLSRAYAFVRREKQAQFRTALMISFLLAGSFCVVQTLGILQLLELACSPKVDPFVMRVLLI